jgi:hypothetical protein
LYFPVNPLRVSLLCSKQAGLFVFMNNPVLIYALNMDTQIELLRNVLAAMVSAGTIIFFLLRYFKKERIEQAHHIAQIIKLTADNVFNSAQLETRVITLEKQERENSEYMRRSFNKLNERLDQIFTIIAQKDQ